jgi:N-acetylglucosaminyldiphosphoundecaprenol N-acetyl-beta-D-mannosaminyltransferase
LLHIKNVNKAYQAHEADFFPAVDKAGWDDLSREVFGVLGIPIDFADASSVLLRIEAAANNTRPFLLTTPNLNFLVMSRADPELKESLLLSDLCPADGMAIVWLARVLGTPIRQRVAGADIYEMLQAQGELGRQLKVFLFGGGQGVAAGACDIINARATGMRCVGWLYPGYGSIDEMSTDQEIDRINASGADFLAVFLGAKKGQAWLLHNHHRLKIPIRSHLGATLNFQVGKVRRAPQRFREWGLEWVWRIKEEPYLWNRYLHDGLVLFGLMLTHVLPLVLRSYRRRDSAADKFQIHRSESAACVTVAIQGAATADKVDTAISCFRAALAEANAIRIDLLQTTTIDSRFFGLLLMLRKRLRNQGGSLQFTEVSHRMRRLFHLNGFEFLLAGEEKSSDRD